MNILFAASEAQPYAASGGLADVVGSLPKAICAKGHDCRIVMPLYKSIILLLMCHGESSTVEFLHQ